MGRRDGTNRSLVNCGIAECGKSKVESKRADFTVE